MKLQVLQSRSAALGAQLTEIDTDGDGLTDFYEELLGLDPGSDSDGDGLIDDTDDDGFT